MKMAAVSPTKPSTGFTLIELLIVVAIIAILAAIAVPNFLEAQTRSKISRSLADMRTLRTGLESYAVDNNKYPENDVSVTTFNAGYKNIFRLTTPISYVTSIPRSPFKEKYGTATPADPKIASLINAYLYVPKYQIATPSVPATSYMTDREAYLGPLTGMSAAQKLDITQEGFWLIKSVGPDNLDDRDSTANQGFGVNARVYDATNGTISRGDIVVFNDRAGTGKNI